MKKENFKKYLLSFILVGAATCLQYFLWPIIGSAPFILYYPAIILAALYGDGISAIIFSSLITQYLFVEPRYSFLFTWPNDYIRQILFILSALMIRQITVALSKAKTRTLEEKNVAEEAKLWLSTTLSSIGDAVITTDNQERITFMNSIAEDLTEWSTADAMGQPVSKVFQIINQQTRIPSENPVSQALAKGHIVGLTDITLLIGRHGKESVVEDSAAPIRVSHNKPIEGVVLVFRNSTEKYLQANRLAEAAELALESEGRLRSILLNALDAVVGMNDQGFITHWNAQAEIIFGFTQAEATGQRMSETIIPHQHREAHERGMKHYLASNVGPVLNRRIEITAIRKSGEEFPIELSITPIKTKDSSFFAAFIRDITDRKTSERDLLESKEAAERANVAKTQFLANMSHEIRTPLGVIQGFAELLQDHSSLPEEQKKWVETIRRNTHLLTNVIGEILDLSRVEADKLDIESLVFSLKELLDDVSSSMRFKAEEKTIAFHIAIDEDIPALIKTDPTRLRQILLNLIGNAIKFTEKGHVTVRFARPHDDTHSSHLSVLISDTGMGMTQEQQEKIFEPFMQGDSSMNRRFGGTGLGLAIAKRLATALQGNLELIKSSPGGGSVFEFTFRCIEENQKMLEKNAASTQILSPHKNLKDKHVLLVEDSIDNQVIVQHFLNESGLKIEIANNGHEAITKSFNQQFDLILMDIQMPGMDGYEALKTIREQGHIMPIIALTAHAFKEERDRAQRAGFDAYLTKPITKVLLLQKIEEILIKEV